MRSSEIVLAMTLPHDKNSYFESVGNENKEFAKLFGGNWAKYDYQFVQPYSDLVINSTTKIVDYKNRTSYSDLKGFFEEYKVIILWSHWSKNNIELYDGFYGIDQIINCVPMEFTGIIDLCVCHPDNLVRKLKVERPFCTVKFTNRKAIPIYWFEFYRVLFDYLAKFRISYQIAINAVTKSYLALK